MATPTVPAPQQPSKPTVDLISSLVVILISAAITIFVFWISAQYLGQSNFTRLPDFITGTFKGLWSTVITGSTGIGLAIIRALTSKGEPQPNYLLLIGLTTACFLVPITILIVSPTIREYLGRGKSITAPANVAHITSLNQDQMQFDLEEPPMNPQYQTYILRGTFTVKDGVVNGHLDSGKFLVGDNAPSHYFQPLTRVGFRVCYLHPDNGIDQLNAYPPSSKAEDSIELNANLGPNSPPFEFPKGDFRFQIPADLDLHRAWLCAAIWVDGGAYFPAQ